MRSRGKQYSVVLSIGGKWNRSVEIDGHTKSGSAASCQHWSNKGPARCVGREGSLLARSNELRNLPRDYLAASQRHDALTMLRLEDHFDGGSIDPSREDETVEFIRLTGGRLPASQTLRILTSNPLVAVLP